MSLWLDVRRQASLYNKDKMVIYPIKLFKEG